MREERASVDLSTANCCARLWIGSATLSGGSLCVYLRLRLASGSPFQSHAMRYDMSERCVLAAKAGSSVSRLHCCCSFNFIFQSIGSVFCCVYVWTDAGCRHHSVRSAYVCVPPDSFVQFELIPNGRLIYYIHKICIAILYKRHTHVANANILTDKNLCHFICCCCWVLVFVLYDGFASSKRTMSMSCDWKFWF